MRIECSYTKLVNLENLIPHPNNRNKHSQKQIEVLAKIIAKVGQRSPIVVSKRSGYVVKGHGRLEALKLLGWESAAVDFQAYESELEELNDRIADNEIARYSEFDKDGFFQDLKEFNLDIKNIDFEEFGKINLEFTPEEDFNIEEINRGDENAEWVGQPDFEEGKGYIQLIYHFKTESEREQFVNSNNINVDFKRNKQWIVHYNGE